MLINKIIRLPIYLLIVASMNSCTTLSSNIEDTKKEIIGTNIDSLYTEWGAPSTSASLPSLKGMVYVWDRGGCKNNVTTDNTGIITNYSATGNCSFIQW